MQAQLLRAMLRKKQPVDFRDGTRTVPVSSNFGWDRGVPVDRYYIERFFRENAALIRGNVLEVGDSSYSRKYADGKADAISVLRHAAQGGGETAIIGDLMDKTTLPENVFDCFICAQTFQYTFELDKAVAGAHLLLKPGGVLLATVPGISQISRQDSERYGEFWRFTTESVTRLFAPVFGGGVEVASLGNVLAATAFLQGLAQEDLPDLSLLDVHDPEYPLIITLVARK
jgi:SAM-dependent methyltransferase